MEIKFGPGETTIPAQVIDVAATVTPVAATPTAPATPAPVAAAAPAPAPAPLAVATQPRSLPLTPSGMVLGDKLPAFDEIVLPRVNVVQGIGALKDTFEPGSLVLNQAALLYLPGKIDAKLGTVLRAPSKPVSMLVLGFRPTRYCEKVPGGGRGIIVNTEGEVRANGGTLDYKEFKLKEAAGMKRFEPMADALVAIERPETVADDETLFVYPVGDKKFALAFWAFRGVAYTAAAKRVFFTARAIGCLRNGGYPSWTFAVTTRLETYTGTNQAWVPVCVPAGRTSPELLEFAKGILEAPAAPAPEEAADTCGDVPF